MIEVVRVKVISTCNSDSSQFRISASAQGTPSCEVFSHARNNIPVAMELPRCRRSLMSKASPPGPSKATLFFELTSTSACLSAVPTRNCRSSSAGSCLTRPSAKDKPVSKQLSSVKKLYNKDPDPMLVSRRDFAAVYRLMESHRISILRTQTVDLP